MRYCWLGVVLYICFAQVSTAFAPGDAVNALLRQPSHRMSLLQITNSPYWDRLVRRFTPEYSDSSGIQDMILEQQHYRRSTSFDQVGTNPARKDLDAYDCVPSFKVRRSETRWFHTRTLDIGMCFSLCMDYPRCSTTTPLVHAPASMYPSSTPPGRPNGPQDFHSMYTPSALYYCGIQGYDRELGDLADLHGRAVGEGGSKPVCTNIVDHGVGMRGVHVKQVSPPAAIPGSNRARLTVEAFVREAKPFDGELVVSTVDLWSHWRMPLLAFSKLGNASVDGELYMLWSGFHDGKALSRVITQAVSGKKVVKVMDAAWVLIADVKERLDSAYAVMRPDLGADWFAFVFYGDTRSSTSTVLKNMRDVNNWCESVLSANSNASLPRVARALNASRLAKKEDLVGLCSPLNLISVTTEADLPHGAFAYGGTTFFRQHDRTSNRCPIILDKSTSTSPIVFGCPTPQRKRSPLFILNQYGDEEVCQGGNIFTTPVIESRLHTGALQESYADAYKVFVETSQLSPKQRGRWLMGGREDPGYAMLADASGHANKSRVLELQQRELKQAEDLVRDVEIVDKSEGAIIVAFTQLFIATITMIMMWGPATQETALMFIDKLLAALQRFFAACTHRGRGLPSNYQGPPEPSKSRLVLLGLVRFVVAAAIFGPALFSFISVTAQGTGTSYLEGYPTSRYLELEHAACGNARTGNPGLGVVRVATVRIEQQTWAVALVCSLSGVVLLGVVVLTLAMIWHTTKQP